MGTYPEQLSSFRRAFKKRIKGNSVDRKLWRSRWRTGKSFRLVSN